jgi:non-ribosomal peptide synthetase component F
MIEFVPKSLTGNMTRPMLLHELFEQRARDVPERIAISSGARRLTYRELDQGAEVLARSLAQAGVPPGFPIAVGVDASIESVARILGALKAGAAYQLAPAARRLRLAVPAQDESENLRADPTTAALAATGGRSLSHDAILSRLIWIQAVLPFGFSDRVWLRTTPPWALFAPLSVGAELVLPDPDADPLSELARARVTALPLGPEELELLLDERDLSACAKLRAVYCEGEITAQVAAHFRERLPGVRLVTVPLAAGAGRRRRERA